MDCTHEAKRIKFTRRHGRNPNGAEIKQTVTNDADALTKYIQQTYNCKSVVYRDKIMIFEFLVEFL